MMFTSLAIAHMRGWWRLRYRLEAATITLSAMATDYCAFNIAIIVFT